MIQLIVLIIAAASTVWSLAVWLVGGFRISLGGILIVATDPLRPLSAAAIAAFTYALLAGAKQIGRDLVRVRKYSAIFALVLALCPAITGLARNSWTAAGADSYAYVSQADLWLHGRQTVLAPIASVVPWPNPMWTLSPYGFRPAASGNGLVPMTSPGLSLLMAAAKAIGGHCAMFWVVPITGALLVWMTFAIGRRLSSSDAVGIAAAWLMATSPAFLAMLVSPMSDVPAAALWAVAIYFTLGNATRDAILAGLAASIAILIRANLAPLAVVLFVGKILILNRRTAGHLPREALCFAAGVLPACVAIALLNNSLYGSPLASGYGDLSSLFGVQNVATNLRRYGGWFIDSQTPIAAVGLAALFVESWLLLAFAAAVLLLYLPYTPFDAWWYLRFLLPAWPAICIGTATLLLRPLPRQQTVGRVVGVIALAAIGVHGMRFAATHGAFPTGEGDHRYASIAKLIEQFTDASSVIVTGQNTGPTRYYSGRLTLRFDQLDGAWLDRTVAWLSANGRRPYFLLEEWEVPLFQNRFATRNVLGALPLTPVLAYQAPGVPGRIYLFDPARPDGPTLMPALPASARPKCVEPALPPMLNLR